MLAHGWNATAYQILNPGMVLWFSDVGDAVAGYVRFNGTRVVAGAPVCTEDRLNAVADELEHDARRHNETVIYFGAGSRLATHRTPASSHSCVQVGAQPVWNPQSWEGIVARKGSLRAQLHRARNKGVMVTEHRGADAPIAELQAVLAEWLSFRGLPPLHFLVEPDLFGNLADRRLFIARRQGIVDAFLIATPVPARNGWLVEEWPRRRAAPNGTTHLLVDAAMRAFADNGSRYATLGLAPLSEMAGRVADGQPAWLRMLLMWLRAHGSRFYNFRGLEAFKAAMLPESWEPIHVITQGRRFSPLALRTIAGAFSAGSPELLVTKGFLAAARKELSRITR